MRRVPQIFLLGLLLSLAILAQQPDSPKPQPTPPPTESQQPSRSGDDDVVRITTKLVQVDAVVTDKNGKLIKDLRQDEVQIFEDGHEQKITNFSLVNVEQTAPAQPANAAPVEKNAPQLPAKMQPADVRRTIALVVDDLGLSFESTHYTRRALKKFVDEQMQPGDLVAIIRTSGGIGALQQFTADKRQLYAAIDRVKWFLNGRSSVGAFAPMENNTPNDDTFKATNAAAQAANNELNQFREDAFAVGTLGAVGYVVKGMRDLPGRKSILLISDGFKIYSAGDPSRNYRTLLALRRLIDQANRATVVIYTMNATGLQVLGLSASDSTGGKSAEEIEQQLSDRRTSAFESQDGLNYLAKETGGIAIRNTNDLSGGIRRVIEDQRSYYLIGYRPDESTFDEKSGRRTFHKLSLKVTRSGKFNVRMRNGFYGITEDDERNLATTPRQQLLTALTSPFGAAGVHLRLTTLFANDARIGSYMRSLLHINANDLTFTDLPDDMHQAVFDVVAITFGDNGSVVDQVGQSYTMKINGPDYARLRRDGFVFFLTVPIKKAGAYQLRAALRDHASEHVGSASQFIEVPDIKKNRLVISGILVNTVDSAGTNTAATPGDVVADQSAAASSTQADAKKIADATLSVRAATRQLKRGQVLQYSVIIYNARLDKTTTKPQLQTQLRLFRDGQLVFAGKETLISELSQSDSKRITMLGAVKLGADLTPGEYVLQITATDPLADEKHRVATQWIDFEIVK
ncbi:MAG TPA: VWA domain-containing protein [Pyrinomonadaceae bacterium]|jgi:VWFA-related protein|nr:VWA domain-containing protein [Pyrinomonadaceae bacterium]